MSKLEISEIQIIPVKPQNGLLAFCSFIINNQLYIGDVAIYSRLSGGYRLVYPSKVLVNGRNVCCVYPINKETGKIIQKAISKKYLELMSKVKIV
ncbi:septation protein SpoVG family protein [Candidatus Pacearchaeota archaeon]|nr:septation protein SpoVG family protein [Candidatus Pacearchaeota archaeon]